jgi:hypothetical protein
MEEEKCESCKYFFEMKSIDPGFGVCRRYPPQRILKDSYFPILSANQWCGEYKQK